MPDYITSDYKNFMRAIKTIVTKSDIRLSNTFACNTLEELDLIVRVLSDLPSLVSEIGIEGIGLLRLVRSVGPKHDASSLKSFREQSRNTGH